MRVLKKSKGYSDKIISEYFRFSGISTLIILAGIFFILFYNSIPFFAEIPFYKIFNLQWMPNPYDINNQSFGIFSLLMSTVMVTTIALAISIPLGVLVAVYLVFLAPAWLNEILKPLIEFLAAIPSVVIGFLGVVLIGPIIANVFGLPNGLNALNGGILLAVMALPTIVSISEDSLKAVPGSYLEASYSLGATKWSTLWRVAIPSALSGIIAGIMLGLGRAMGETMTVLMATGNSMMVPLWITDQVRTLTATIAIEMSGVAVYETHYYALFMVGLVLFIFSFAINTISYFLTQRYQEIER